VNKDVSYLDLQGLAGVSKHTGGFPATEELLSMCHIEDASEALEVGCGIGVGAAHMARKYGLRVVAVDISEKMLDWARQRAEQEGVAERVEFRLANVLDLPFEADRFDLVICESVLAFVQDKTAAIAEMKRVLKPGGYLGLNEVAWLGEPPAGLIDKASAGGMLGTEIVTVDRWRELWAASGLEDAEVRVCQIDATEEVRSRIAWIGWRQVLRAWRRILPMFLTQPAMRSSLKQLMDTPREWFGFCSYLLLAGRKSVPPESRRQSGGAQSRQSLGGA
jgi:SAM-dependent methyltransferase